MAENKELDDSALIEVIKGYRKDAIGPTNKEVTNDRVDAFDHYYGRPYGNEEDDSSQIVTRDLAETVDWIMPALMRMYLQSGNVCEFDPVGKEDEDLSRQETDYTNHVIMKKNKGFLIVHDVVKDILLLKNGYAKHWYNESEKISHRDYEDISDDELTMTIIKLSEKYDEIEIVRQTVNSDDDEEPVEDVESEDMEFEMDELAEPVKYTVRLKLKRKLKEIKIEAVPPEELLIEGKARGSLQDANFVEHMPRMTRSDLVEMGMDKDWVYDLPAKSTNGTTQGEENTYTSESDARDSSTDQSNSTGLPVDDKSMEEVDYRETYVRVDQDQDGIAELRKIINVADHIPDGDEWNEVVDTIPFSGGVAKRVPHRHLGESLDDDMGDLQLIHTTLMRQMLDNIYHTNHVQIAISDKVNEIDAYENAPGGVKRIKDSTAEGHIVPIPIQSIVDKIIPAIDHVKMMKDTRTGINEMTTGVNPNILQDTTKGAFMENLSRASQKVEMIGRMIAETFLIELVLRVHELIIKHVDSKQYIKLRGTFVEIDPSEWMDRDDLTIKVGLGTGTGEDRAQRLGLLSAMQDKLYEKGLIGPEEAYEMFVDIALAMGAPNPEKYVIDPSDNEAFQKNRLLLMGMAMKEQSGGGSNPLAEAEAIKAKAKIESDTQSNEAKLVMKQMELEHDQAMANIKAQLDTFLQAAKIQSEEAIAAATLEMKGIVEGIKIDLGKPGIGAGLQDGGTPGS